MKKRLLLILLCCLLLLVSCKSNPTTENQTVGTTNDDTIVDFADHLIQSATSYEEYQECTNGNEIDSNLRAVLKAIDPFVKIGFTQSPNEAIFACRKRVRDKMIYCEFDAKAKYALWENNTFVHQKGVKYKSCLDVIEVDRYQLIPAEEHLIGENLLQIKYDQNTWWHSTAFANNHWYVYQQIGQAYYCWEQGGLLVAIVFETDDYVVAVQIPYDVYEDPPEPVDSPYSVVSVAPELQPYVTLSTAPEAINKLIAAANGETVQ